MSLFEDLEAALSALRAHSLNLTTIKDMEQEVAQKFQEALAVVKAEVAKAEGFVEGLWAKEEATVSNDTIAVVNVTAEVSVTGEVAPVEVPVAN